MAKDMTKNELKEYLKDFRKIQAQKQYYDYILENDEYSTNYASDFKLFECVKLSLTILDEKEYFISSLDAVSVRCFCAGRYIGKRT